jgi:hypothetical protein
MTLAGVTPEFTGLAKMYLIYLTAAPFATERKKERKTMFENPFATVRKKERKKKQCESKTICNRKKGSKKNQCEFKTQFQQK